MHSVLTDMLTDVGAYGTAAALLVGGVLAITIGLRWAKKFTSGAA